MKNKYFLGLIVGVFGLVFLTGCGGSGNKVTCSADLKEGDTKYGTAEIVAELDDSDKVKTVEMTMKIDDKDAAQQVFSMITLANSFAENDSQKIDASLDGNKITIKNAEAYLNQTESETKLVGMSKADFIKLVEEDKNMNPVCK